MDILPKKDFAAQCGLLTNKLWKYVDRGNVILLGDGKVDLNDPRNRAFLEMRQAKLKPNVKIEEKPLETLKQITNIKTGTPQPDDEPKHDSKSLINLEVQKTMGQVAKINQEVVLLKIKEEKIKGVVVPSELIKPVFLQHNQSILTEIHNEANEFVRIFAKRHSLKANEVADIKSDLIDWVNIAIDKAIQLSSNQIDNIINTYQEERGVGERK